MGKLTIILLIIGTFISCSKDRDDEDSFLEGKWILKDVSCFCGPKEEGLGKNSLQFNVRKKEVTVDNSNQENSWLKSGTFSYTLTLEKNGMQIEGSPYCSYEINGNELQMYFDPIPAMMDDEFILIYKKE